MPYEARWFLGALPQVGSHLRGKRYVCGLQAVGVVEAVRPGCPLEGGTFQVSAKGALSTSPNRGATRRAPACCCSERTRHHVVCLVTALRAGRSGRVWAVSVKETGLERSFRWLRHCCQEKGSGSRESPSD
jgi:hypothetical protein